MRKEASRKRKERLDNILKLIKFFDEARARRISNPSEFETITKGVRGSRKDLKAVKKDFDKMVSLAESSKKIRKLVRVTSALEITSFCLFVVVLIVSVIYYFTKPSGLNQSLLVYFFQGAVIAMIVLPCTFLIMRRYTERKLRMLYDQHSMELKGVERRAREIVQRYIFVLGREIRRYEMNPRKFQFRLYHDDYKGIEILHKPGAFSSFYVAVAKINRES